MTRLYWFRWAQSPDPVLPDPIVAASLKQAVHKLGLVKNGPLWAHNAYMDGRIELWRTQELVRKQTCKILQTELALQER